MAFIIYDSNFNDAARCISNYQKSVERFSAAKPSVRDSEIEFDRSFNELCLCLKEEGIRHILEEILKLHGEAVRELELGLIREERHRDLEIEIQIAQQAGIKRKNSIATLQRRVPEPEQLNLFNNTEELVLSLKKLHEQRRILITNARRLEKRQKKIVKGNVKQASISSCFAVAMFVGNGFGAPALLPYSAGAGFFALHTAVRDLM